MFDWRLPFKRWCLAQHAMVAALALLLVAAAGGWLLRQAAQTLASVQAQQQALDHEVRRRSGQAQPPAPGDFAAQLPHRVRTDHISRDIGAFASAAGVDIQSLTIGGRANSSHELGWVQFSVTAQAEYQASKAWLGELLARYPALGVQSLTLNASPNESTQQQVQLVLVWYVND